MKKQLLLVVAVLVILGQSIKVQCEHQKSSWQPKQQFYLGQREVLVPTIYGLDVVVDNLDQVVSAEIKRSGSWQPRNIRAMAKLVKQGDTILNIGAHIGLQAIVLTKGAGPKSRLFIFQPTQLTYPMLIKNIFINELEDITTSYKMGAGSAYSKGITEVHNYNTGSAYMITDPNFKPGYPPNTTYYEITIDRADNVLPKNLVVDFALIDTESQQLQVLEGLKQTIARSPNLIIMSEWWGWSFLEKGEAQKMESILRWLQQHKYRFYYLKEGNGKCDDIVFIEQTLDEVKAVKIRYNDIYYVPQHIDPNRL